MTSPQSDPFLRVMLDELFPSNLAYNRRIFVNRNLRLDKVKWIGFDMDYTLALYRLPMELLAYSKTMEKLVGRGYSEEILDFEYNPRFPIRGLIIDHRCGNIIKMDRYRHVGRVYHGMTRMPDDQRREMYRKERLVFNRERFYLVDTLFALPETFIYARMVEYLEQKQGGPLDSDGYHKLFLDIRGAIDESHQDNTIKDTIMADIQTYVQRDDQLALTLHKFRSAGKKLFLMTNSYYTYSNALMSWLFNNALEEYESWKQYFDVIIVGAKKPEFFTKERPFLRVAEDGSAGEAVTEGFERGQAYQGGNLVQLEEWLGAPEDGILYVGDHIYGDILRSKKSTLWRTAMVVQEMESELAILESMEAEHRLQRQIELRRTDGSEELNRLQIMQRALVRLNSSPEAEKGDEIALLLAEIRQRVAEQKAAREKNLRQSRELDAKIDCAFNEYWGKLFTQGVEHSQFGNQVEDYACIYTSRVSNFLNYSPIHFFRSPRDPLAHELVYWRSPQE